MANIVQQVMGMSDDETNKVLESIIGRPKQELDDAVKKINAKIEAIQLIQPKDGVKGDKGDQGIQGSKGDPGKDGRDGYQGKDGKQGVDGKDGLDGKDGVSIVDVNVAFDNHLVVTLSDGTEIDAGVIGDLNANLQNVVANYVSNGANGTLIFKGLWNASTNTPTLSVSSSDAGAYYVVNVAGSTNLSGITDWQVNDWAIFNGTAWQKIDNSDLFNASAVAITGGAIDGTTIGSTTASTGRFTSVTTPSVTASSADLTLNTAGSGVIRNNLPNSVAWQMSAPASTVTRFMAGGQSVLEARLCVPSFLRFQIGSTADFTGEGSEQMRITNTASAVNYVQVTGSATTKAPIYSVAGSDTNISMAFQPKGTGAIDLAAGSSGVNISNGGTVTAITRTTGGSGYTGLITAAISAPTTAGGVQATVAIGTGAITQAIVSGGTGYTVGNILNVSGGTIINSSVQQIRVDTVSSGVITGISVAGFGQYTTLPTNPVSVTGGSGSGATFNLSNFSFVGSSITNAGSGYIEQPTITFSGGGGSGAAAYAIVGSGTIIRSLANTLDIHTPAGSGFQVNNVAGSTLIYSKGVTGYGGFLASSITGNSAFYFGYVNNTEVGRISMTSSNNLSFGTSSSALEQLRVANTASAVNFVQVTGSATGSNPTISSQGTDTNIDLALTPKGTGLVRFGTYVAGALLATGYINIKAADGTTYKVLVST